MDINTYYHDKIGMGLYHLNPRWCIFADFDYFVSRGFTNAFICDLGTGTSIYAAERAAETGAQMWAGAGRYYSSRQTIGEFIKDFDKKVQIMKDAGVWDTFVGFHWDEPLLDVNHTNEDFLIMTRALTEQYGKRIFPVFSGYETTGRKGNWNDPEGLTILRDYATDYITDYGFDSYGYDFRMPHNTATKNRIAELAKDYPEITSPENYYRYYFKVLKDRIHNKKARMWVFPTAYTTYTYAGTFSDEDYCVAHLEGLKKLLLESENPGGIMGYTFKSWRKGEPAMDIHLAKENPERWNRYEAALQKTFDQIKDIKINL